MRHQIILLILATLFLTACAPKMDAVNGQANEVAQELGTDLEASEEGVDSTAAQSGDSQEYTTWNTFNLPSQFPEYTDGRIQKPFSLQDWYPIILGIENTSVEAVEAYVQRALQSGYSLQWEHEIMGDEDLSWAVSMETDEQFFNVILSYFEEYYGIPNYINLLLDVREK